MKNPLFCGTCTAMVTPFLNGKINYPMMQILLRRQTDAGIAAVVIAGTTGEAATLTDAEKLELFRFSRACIGNDCLLIAGTGSNDTAHAVALSIAAQDAGADAVLVVSPYYNKATPEGIYAHYLQIARAVDIPVIIYNVPSRTGLDIPVDTYRKLSYIPNIAGVKEASSDIVKILQTRISCPEPFGIWAGNDDQTVAAISTGANGVISVASNLYPGTVNAMTRYALNGEQKAAFQLQAKLLPLIKQLFCEVNPIPAKSAMAYLGYDCGQCRLPLTQISDKNGETLQQLCAALESDT